MFLEKKVYMVTIIVFSLLGSILIIPSVPFLELLEKGVCGNERFGEKDLDGNSLCEKLLKGQFSGAENYYCQDGVVYRQDQYESCITKIVFFPFVLLTEGQHPDGTIIFLPFILLWGGLIGGIISFLICFIVDGILYTWWK